MIRIRRAKAPDAEAVAELIRPESRQGVMLDVSADYVLEHLSHYFVAESVRDHRIVGAVFLRVYSPVLAEIRSLVVHPELRGHGVGRRLIRHAVKEAKRLGVRKVFALTLVPEFFKRLGFVEENKEESFPEKIWADCASCPKKDACDEVTLSLTLAP